jgi:hypothetical protein
MGNLSVICGRHIDHERCDYHLKVYVFIEFSIHLEPWEAHPSGCLFITQWNQ